MRYITFFQFLRRCLLLDAEEHTLPPAISKRIGGMLHENRTGEAAKDDREEQAGRSGGPGDTGTGGPEPGLLPLQIDAEK